MEKAIHRHYLHHRSPSQPNRNRHQAHKQYGAARLPMRLSILQRIYATNQLIHPLNRFLDPKFFSTNNMADQSKATQSSDKPALNKPEAEQRLEVPSPLPPPPEKPLPGDCCGSGCVRCVWDIYYEELDEYDKLCKSKSDSLSNLKPS